MENISAAKAALKRPAENNVETQDIETTTKKFKFCEVIKREGSGTAHVCKELSPENFLEHFLLPVLEERNQWVLINWLIEINILSIPTVCKCGRKGSEIFQLAEEPSLVDKYFWKCSLCKCRLSLRHGSIFKRDRASACSLQDALFCILAWCQQMPVEIAGELLDLDDSIVMVWYHRCRAAVNEYMQRKFQSKFIFGGEGSVVLLDLAKTIPPSTLKHDSRRKYRDRFRTLYIADTNHIPVRNWVHILPSFRKPEKLFQIYRSRISSSDCNTIAQHNIVTQKVESEKTNEDGETQNCFAVDIDAVTSPNGFTNTSNSSPDHRKLRILKEQQDLNETRVVLTDICSKTQRNIPEEQIKKKDERTLSTDLAMCVQEECSQFELESHPIKEIENLNMFNEVEAYLRKLECTDFVLKSVKHLIAPGSFVVANEAALPNICEALRKAGRYEAVVSFSEIGCIDEEGHRPTKAILDRLFQPANEHCFGSSTHGGANQRAAEFNWRQIFGMNTSYAAYHIMHIMGSYSS